jgi:hypothetical protein
MRKWLAVIFLFQTASAAWAAPEFTFTAPAAGNRAALAQAMSQLAHGVMAIYRDSDRPAYLDNLFRLQMAAGQYEKAAQTIAAIRALPDVMDPPAGAGARGTI